MANWIAGLRAAADGLVPLTFDPTVVLVVLVMLVLFGLALPLLFKAASALERDRVLRQIGQELVTNPGRVMAMQPNGCLVTALVGIAVVGAIIGGIGVMLWLSGGG